MDKQTFQLNKKEIKTIKKNNTMFELFKKPEYRRFNLKPCYWDPEKEERELREKRIKAELSIKEEDEKYIPNIQGQFKQEFERRKRARNSIMPIRTIRLFMILILLFLAAFYLYIKNSESILQFFGL